MNYLDDPKFTRAVALFRMEFRAMQRLHAFLRSAYAEHGCSGNVVSGGHCDGWPQSAKQRSRRLNRMINRLQHAAFKARPPRFQHRTMRNLRLDVQIDESRK